MIKHAKEVYFKKKVFSFSFDVLHHWFHVYSVCVLCLSLSVEGKPCFICTYLKVVTDLINI